MPCAFIMGFAAACLLALCLLPPAASAREIAEVDSPEWCAILCCFDPDDASCRAAAASIPAFLATPKR